MIKIIVISDTHGNASSLISMYDLMRECDYIFHLGDGYLDMSRYESIFGEKLYRVRGNNDFLGKRDIVVKIGEKRIFATHGDLYGVKMGTQKIVKEAKAQGCSIALYGHTHYAEIKQEDGVLLINPGTLSKYATRRTFAYLVIDGEKVVPVINDKYF